MNASTTHAGFRRSVTLSDGTVLEIRPLLPSDRPEFEAALASADEETLYRRFLTARPRLSADQVRHLIDLDHHRRSAVVAFAGDQPVGLARYEGDADLVEAEVAITVTPDWRRRGVATVLLEVLSELAAGVGFTRLTAVYQMENTAVARLLSGAGFTMVDADGGVATASRPVT